MCHRQTRRQQAAHEQYVETRDGALEFRWNLHPARFGLVVLFITDFCVPCKTFYARSDVPFMLGKFVTRL